jgi:ElaB/YqjD/DUF883 family membrane-anchored ribosome-binding protein
MASEPSSSDFASGNPLRPTDGLSAAAEKLRAADLGRKAADTVDQARSSVAAGLSTAAGVVQDGADESGKRARRAAQATAKAISRGADYLRDNSARDMAGDAMDVVKNNPGFALLGAIALGFLLGRAFSSRT